MKRSIKRLLSLNLAIIMALSMVVWRPSEAHAYGDNGYAVFYKNDGSGESTPQTMGYFRASTSDLLLYEAAPKYDGAGKVVIAYNTEPDGSGTTYALTERLRATHSTDESAPAQLYAMWETVTQPYILYLNTDCTEPAADTYRIVDDLSGETALLGEDAFSSYGGKNLTGWLTAIHGDSRYYMPGEAVSVDTGLTLLAETGVNYINFHYMGYDYSSRDYVWQSNCRRYRRDDIIGYYSHGSCNGKMFVGWNTQPNGSGEWHTDRDSVGGAPHELYAVYEDYPTGEYVILRCDSGLANGKMYDFLALSEGKATLPRELRNGGIAVAWQSYPLTYPCGILQTVENKTKLTAQVAGEDAYRALIDGDGGMTADGSAYGFTSCFVTSAGDLNVYTFNEVELFERENSVPIGYLGQKTGKLYDFNADVWAALGVEADENNVAGFTAQYDSTDTGYLLYLGNRQYTAEGESSVRQDIDFSDKNGVKLISAPFTAPSGKYFIGWNTKADGRGEWYDPGTEIPFEKNTALYAQWGKNRITYHYEQYNEPRSRTWTNSNSIFSYQSYNASPSALFEGWNTMPDGSGDWYLSNEPVPDGAVLDLYERWLTLPEEGYYYVLAGRRMENDRMAQLYSMNTAEETVILPDVGNLGWYPDGTYYDLGKENWLEKADFLRPGQSTTVQSGTILRRLDANHSTTYHKNFGTDTEQHTYYSLSSFSSLCIYDSATVFGDDAPQAEFVEWNTRSNGSGKSYSPGQYFYDGNVDLYAQWQISNAIDNQYTFVSSRQVNHGQSVSVSADQGTGWYLFVIDCSTSATDLALYDSASRKTQMFYSVESGYLTKWTFEGVYGAYLQSGEVYTLNVIGGRTPENLRRINEAPPYTLLTYYAAELPVLRTGEATEFHSLDDSRLNWQHRFAVFTPQESGWYRLSVPDQYNVDYQIIGCLQGTELHAERPAACRVLSTDDYQYSLLLHAGSTYIVEYKTWNHNWSYFDGKYSVKRVGEAHPAVITDTGEYPMRSYSNAKLSLSQSGVYCICANAGWNPTLFDSDGVAVTPVDASVGPDNTSIYYRLEGGESYYLYSDGYTWSTAVSEPKMNVRLSAVETVLEQGVSLDFSPEKKTAQITVSKEWCVSHDAKRMIAALYDGGRMIGCAVGRFDGENDLVLSTGYSADTIPKLALFSLGEQGGPVYRAITCEPAIYFTVYYH